MERSPAVFLDAARRAGDGGRVQAQGRPPCVIIVLRRRFEAERGGGVPRRAMAARTGVGEGVVPAQPLVSVFALWYRSGSRPTSCAPGAARRGTPVFVLTGVGEGAWRPRLCTGCLYPSGATGIPPVFFSPCPTTSPSDALPPAVNARALVRSAGRRGGLAPSRMCTRHVEGDGGKDYHATLFANGGLPRWEDRFVLREGPRDASSATNRQAAWAKSPIRSAVFQLTLDLSTCVLILTSDLLPTGPHFLGMS